MSATSGRPRFVFRGTTRSWTGNPSCAAEARTCTTTDPLIATLFAVHCRNFGSGILHIFRVPADLDLESGNALRETEDEVVVPMTPLEFESAAACTVSADVAIEVLAEFGIECPHRLPKVAERLTEYLRCESRRLSPDEIFQFVRSCGVPSDD